MTRKELIEYCLSLPLSYEDYPFDDIVDESAWTAMRHQANKKCFAFITVHNGRLMANLKCDPFEADFLRQAFTDVTPGYHMNKTHWNSVYIGGDVPEDELKRMIEKSYDLIKPKHRNREN
jgi:predicted DNA-binding protein (MmcQ/YjbR family)